MKLKTLNLANFRGYDQLTLQLDPELTVIAGVNGVGKSSLLEAITHFASELLPKITASKEKADGLKETDIKVGKDSLNISAEFATDDAQFFVDTRRKCDSHAHSSVRIMPNTSHSVDELTSVMKKASCQPLVVCYLTSRYFKSLGNRGLPKETKKIDIKIAFSQSLKASEISLYEFANWYRVQLENPERSRILFDPLNQAVGIFLDHVSNLELHETRPPKFSVEKNGTRFSLEQLSDGERGLLALVFDLTRRLCIANPTSDAPLTDGKAIVLIDEIELHLHPKWQRMVVRKLREVFPACQFIITTHSPMVLGEVKAESIRFLNTDEHNRVVCSVPSESYGLDANRILQEHMGAAIRNKDIEQQLQQLFLLIDDEKFDTAKDRIRSLSKALGEYEPELTRANTLIEFLEDDDE